MAKLVLEELASVWRGTDGIWYNLLCVPCCAFLHCLCLEPAEIGLLSPPSQFWISAAPLWLNFLLVSVVGFFFFLWLFFVFLVCFLFCCWRNVTNDIFIPQWYFQMSGVQESKVFHRFSCHRSSAETANPDGMIFQSKCLWLHRIAAYPWKSSWDFSFWVCRIGKH